MDSGTKVLEHIELFNGDFARLTNAGISAEKVQSFLSPYDEYVS